MSCKLFLTCLGLLYFLAFLVTVMIVGGTALGVYGDPVESIAQSTELLAGVYDLTRDWQISPFTELKVTDEFYCEEGW